MPEFKRPRVRIPDDDYYYIDQDFVDLVDFDEEISEEELYEFDENEALIVDTYDNYINAAQLEQDSKALYLNTYKPPQVIRVLSKTARTTPAGQVVIDYVFEVEEVAGAKSYEIRVLEQ